MKSLDQIKKIGIIGAGVMGRGIALVAANAGFEVVLQDINADTLEKSKAYFDSFLTKSVERGKLTAEEKPKVIARIHCTTNFDDLVADLFVEAILENLELKQEILSKLEAQNDEDCILTTNTSTIPITRIAAGLSRPQNFAGMHFFNPAPIMKLVEVISGEMTPPALGELIYELAEKMGKKPVHVKDEPGFVVNRVARHFYLESLKILEEQVADHESIDRLMESSGFRMGPFKLMDLIGIETNHEVSKSLYNAFFQDEKFRPSRVQQKKVDAGAYGRKTGKGFYQY